MPDYTSILRRSIAALPDASPAMRDAVYQRARAALARQLTAVDPPLSTREIERQHQELEDAVARLEADFSAEPESDAEASNSTDEDAYQEDGRDSDIAVQPAARPEARIAARRDYDDDVEEDEGDDYEDEESSSRTPLLVGVLLLLIVIGGAGAYVFTERDRFFGGLGGSDGMETVAVEPPPAEDAAPAPIVVAPEPEQPAADVKRPDRMANGSEPPAEDVAAIAPPPEATLPEEAAPADEETLLTPPPSEEETPLPDETQTAAVDPPAQSIVAQRAIFYFQGKEGSAGKATEGTVTWAEITRDNGPAIQAVLRLADQEATTTVTISKNSDGSLPASHLVEVQFSGELGESPIQRVPALVLKQTEQARGQPLTGAAVPVTNELFWIALSDDEEQVASNIQLLREGSWFDIPILFNDGTRALLTFEKGIPGDKVFETVMAGWTPS